MANLEQIISEFEAADTQVLGISCDSVYSHTAWSEYLGTLSFPLLSDFWPHGDANSKFGVFEPDGAGVRATFAIDRDGIIRYAQVAPRRHGRTTSDMRAALHSLTERAQAA